MRIISGSAKGTILISREGLETRPTSDRAREALFSILSYEIPDCSFLDLFAGTGAVGIEALSRGAAFCVFVDDSFEAAGIVRQNLDKAKLSENARILRKTTQSALKTLHTEGRKFDLIFMDPPYNSDLCNECIGLLQKYDLLNNEGIIIAETDCGCKLDEGNLVLRNTRKYGNAKFHFFGGRQ